MATVQNIEKSKKQKLTKTTRKRIERDPSGYALPANKDLTVKNKVASSAQLSTIAQNRLRREAQNMPAGLVRNTFENGQIQVSNTLAIDLDEIPDEARQFIKQREYQKYGVKQFDIDITQLIGEMMTRRRNHADQYVPYATYKTALGAYLEQVLKGYGVTDNDVWFIQLVDQNGNVISSAPSEGRAFTQDNINYVLGSNEEGFGRYHETGNVRIMFYRPLSVGKEIPLPKYLKDMNIKGLYNPTAEHCLQKCLYVCLKCDKVQRSRSKKWSAGKWLNVLTEEFGEELGSKPHLNLSDLDQYLYDNKIWLQVFYVKTHV